jgi:uncharacterized protein YbjT (DUF2867 family)
LNRPETLEAALEGVRGAHLLAGYGGLPERLAQARRAGVERVVLQSSSAVPGGDMSNAVARYHIVSEAAVARVGRRLDVPAAEQLHVGHAAVDSAAAGRGRCSGTVADVRVATIDRYDVAAVSAQALISDGHAGRSYRLSGPESLLPADRVRVLGKVLGRELRFEGQSDAEARQEMRDSMPDAYVDAFFSFFSDGTLDESEVLDTVQQVTERKPRSFEQSTIAHAEAFR